MLLGSDRLAVDDIDLNTGTSLHDRRIQTLVGEGLARAAPTFRALFDKTEDLLCAFVDAEAPLQAEW